MARITEQVRGAIWPAIVFSMLSFTCMWP